MTKFKLNEEKMFADIADGLAIIINAETGIYYGMNKLGTCVYENIINGASTEKIIERLKAIQPELEKQFNDYLKFLTDNQILLVDKENKNEAEVKIDENIAKDDEYTLTAAEYKDAQELLQADPIHEVREEKGWSPEKTSLNEDKEDVARREAKMDRNR